MKFRLRHETRYDYSAPVTLGPQRVRLRPREDDRQRTLRYRLDVEPQPVASRQTGDAYGNVLTELEFDRPTERLVLVSRIEVETRPAVDCEHALDPAFLGLPARYPAAAHAALAGLLAGAPVAAEVAAFAGAVANRAGASPLHFLALLTDELHTGVRREIRLEGDAQSAAETLATRCGACRDLTVLFMESCRAQGLAARFVSGYQDRSSTPQPERHLHAWPEVYLPGCGWRGWDPTRGAPAGETHVALVAAPNQAGTMPLEGCFYAAGSVRSTLSFQVDIETE